MVAFSLCAPMAFPQCVPVFEKREKSLPLLIRSIALSISDPILMNSFNYNYFLKALSPNTVMLGNKSSTYEFGGGRGGENTFGP